jgi:hypothetical protein
MPPITPRVLRGLAQLRFIAHRCATNDKTHNVILLAAQIRGVFTS